MIATDIPLSRTKVVVPARRVEILTRARLLELLYDLLDKKVILISAPAGYGKTSLLIDLAHHAEMQLCWLSLDALDQDVQRFIAYLIASVNQQYPKFGNQSTATLSNLTSLEQDTERLIVTLANEMLEKIPEHFILVLDDYQFIDGVPAIRNFVNRFIQLVGENCHLILSSRTLVTLPDLPLMLGRDQVGGLSFLELAFQPDEIQALFAQNYHRHISLDKAEELVKQTEGWITALQLSGLDVELDAANQLQVARTTGVGLFDYLSQQVLEKQPPELREFLLCSSLLDEFDADLCESVLGGLTLGKPQHWRQSIASVQRNNLFALPVGPEGKWLRYHHLFQDFLRARLEEEHPDWIIPILHRLAQVYEQRSEWEKAYHVYQQLGDLNNLADLIERAGGILLHNDRLISLAYWFENLPDEMIKKRPGLLSLRGSVVVIRGDVQDGLSQLNQAVSTLRSAKDEPNLALNLVRRALAHRHLGNYTASLEDSEEALRLTAINGRLETTRAEAQRIKGLSLYRLGQARQAVEWLVSALAIYTELNEIRSIPILQMELGMAHRAIGEYQSAKVFYEKALASWQKEDNLFWQANLLNNIGVLYHFLGEYEQAVQALEQGLNCARRSGYVRMEALTLTSLGDLYAELEDLEAAQKAYQQAQDIAEQLADLFLTRYLTLAFAGLARAKKDYSRAHWLLDEIKTRIEESGSNYERGLYHLEKGRLLVIEERPEEAYKDLLASNQYFTKGELFVETGWSHIWLAAVNTLLGDEAKAQEEIQNVLKLAAPGQPPNSLFVAAWQARKWLPNSGSNPAFGFTLNDLLSRADQIEKELPAIRRRLRRMLGAIPMSAPRLTIRALGKALVKINVKTVTTSQWQTQSVRDLFFYFLTISQPVTKEQVGSVFWPEASMEQLRLKFKNDIYRLRHAVGQEVILFENDLYYFNRDLDYDYDVETFDSYLVQAQDAQNVQERIDCYRAAVDLVRGPFLADVDAIWVWAERQRLSEAYLAASLDLTGLYLESGEMDQALHTCQRAIAHDACAEEAHRLMMRIYGIRGDHAAVARQYQACRDALKFELDIPPSPETEKLYRSLTM